MTYAFWPTAIRATSASSTSIRTRTDERSAIVTIGESNCVDTLSPILACRRRTTRVDGRADERLVIQRPRFAHARPRKRHVGARSSAVFLARVSIDQGVSLLQRISSSRRDAQRLFGLVHFRARDDLLVEQLLRPCVVGHGVIEISRRLTRIGLGLATLFHTGAVLQAPRVRFSRTEVRFSGCDTCEVIVVRNLRDHLAGRHRVAFFHQDSLQPSTHLRTNANGLRLRFHKPGSCDR